MNRVGWGTCDNLHRYTEKTEIQKLLVSAILDPGNINYSLEFFCPYL